MGDPHKPNHCIVHRSANAEHLLRKNVSLLRSKDIRSYMHFIEIHMKRFRSMHRMAETLQELAWLLTAIENNSAAGGKSTIEIVTAGAIKWRSHRTIAYAGI